MRMQTKALLLKDWLVLSRQMKVFLVLIAVFSAVPVLSVSSFAIVYSAMLPYTAMAFDERDKWDRLAAMMPYRESDLVLSKYLLGYAGLAGVLAVAACSRLLLHRTEELAMLAVLAAVALLVLAFSAPLLFRWGVERGRMLFVFLMVAVATGSSSLATGLVGFDGGDAAGGSLVWLAFVGLALLVQPLSVALSVRGRRKKQG